MAHIDRHAALPQNMFGCECINKDVFFVCGPMPSHVLEHKCRTNIILIMVQPFLQDCPNLCWVGQGYHCIHQWLVCTVVSWMWFHHDLFAWYFSLNKNIHVHVQCLYTFLMYITTPSIMEIFEEMLNPEWIMHISLVARLMQSMVQWGMYTIRSVERGNPRFENSHH